MKKIVSLIICLSIIFTYTSSIKAEGNIDWDFENGILTVFGIGAIKDCNNSKDSVFYEKKEEIKEIVIQKGITEIGNWVFADCINLEKITIPNTITRIGDRAFYNCVKIEYIKIPSSVKEIGNGAFNGCISVKRVDLSDGLSVIGDSAFMNLPNLSGIMIPKTVDSLGSWAFFGNVSMKGLYFEGGVPEKFGNHIIDRINENYYVYYNYLDLYEWVEAEYFDEMRATYFEEDKYIPVYLNNSMVNFDVDPMIENGRTLVPVRAIFEAMGATVDWNGETRIVVAKKGDITVQIPINSDIIYKNSQSIKIDVPAQITDGRTFVPLRAISEAFGAKVEWNAEERFVNIFFE